ncbi:MAG: hypothetical protein ACE5MH_09010, partial [Terriglobia bacterium]
RVPLDPASPPWQAGGTRGKRRTSSKLAPEFWAVWGGGGVRQEKAAGWRPAGIGVYRAVSA